MAEGATNSPSRRPASPTDFLAVRIAGEVIRLASRDRPADAVLREALRSRRVPSSAETREISRAVAPEGLLMLSGIVEGRELLVREAFEPLGLRLVERTQIEDWIGLTYRRIS